MTDEEHEQEIRARRRNWALPSEIELLMRLLDAARAERDAANARADRLEGALEFYADPSTYHAISFIGDSPCGEFLDDLSEDPEGDYDRLMPGKRARAALAPSKGEKP